MKKIFLITLFGTFIAFGQNNGGSINASTDNSYLPNITPASPDSFSISEYGKIKANEFYGKLSYGIPIYNYTAGQLNLPLTLNYSGAGVKVNDISTWTGINWNLTTGGVINRTVNDSPDELSLKIRYVVPNVEHLSNNTSYLCTPHSQEYCTMAFFNEDYDTEMDVFNFSFNGYNGSFYLDTDFKPVFIENENELRIEFIGPELTNVDKFRNSKKFLITTPDGVKYYFGGEQTEVTLNFSGHRGGSIPTDTSFYLYKIEHPIKGTIFLNYYENVSTRLTNLNRIYTLYKGLGVSDNYVPTLKIDNPILQTNNPKILKSISSLENDIVINFNVDIYQANRNFSSVLNSINISSNSTTLKTIDLEYIGENNDGLLVNNNFTNVSRVFLQKVIFDKNIQNKSEIHSFLYNDISALPNRLSNSQDILGYYNGIENVTLVPNNPIINPMNHNIWANRDPDFSLASKGALTKIIYPTGGYSTFEYEPSEVKKKKFKSYTCHSIGTEIASIPGNNGIEENVISTPIYKTQKVNIQIQTGITGNDEFENLMNYQIHHAKTVKLEINDVTNPQNPILHIISRKFGMKMGSSFHEFEFLEGHLYEYKLKILQDDGTTTFDLLNASFTLTLFDGYNRVSGFGVRLKKQCDFDNITQNPYNTIRYYYDRGIKNLIVPVEALSEVNYFPSFSYSYVNNTNEFYSCNINFHSEAKSNEHKETYNLVTLSYGGDNFENGGEEKLFTEEKDMAHNKIKVIDDGCWLGGRFDSGNLAVDDIFCGSPIGITNGSLSIVGFTQITFLINQFNSTEKTEMSYNNGKLLSSRLYKNVNGSIYKVSQSTNNYNFEISNQAVNLVLHNIFNRYFKGNFCEPDLSGTPMLALSDFHFGYYLLYSFKSTLINTKNVTYIEPIPLSSCVNYFITEPEIYDLEIDEEINNELNFKKITTTQNFEYGTLRGLPTVITTNTSDSSIVNKTVNTYVNTASTLPSIPSNQNAIYTSLIAQNRVGSPVQVQQFQNSELLSTQRTLYNNFTVNSVSKILPEKIQIGKGDITVNPLEDKAIFYSYDEHFNPVVMGYANAPKTRYMFNTDGLVVAKIENYTGTATSFPLITGNIDNTNCALQTQYPDSFVTVFTYNLITKKLIQTTDSRCQNSFYEYDVLHRLKLIKDHDGNIIKEYDQQFKPQN